MKVKRNTAAKFEKGTPAKKPVFKIKRAPEEILPPTIVPEPPPLSAMLKVGILGLKNGMCKWPIGDGPFTFCGRKQKPGKVYCEGHCQIAYQPVQKREARNNERLATRHG
jgi:GcrA cell cycle regulator